MGEHGDWGNFQYKKREFSIQDIMIYHHISSLYHCVSRVSSSCISYIMSLVDTWYIACIIVFPSSCYIMWSHVAFVMIHGHDTDTWYIDDIWWYNAKIGLRTPRPPPYMISHDITWYHVPRPQPKPPEHKLWYHDISCSIMNHDTTWYIVIHVMIHEYKNTEMSPRYRMIYDDIRWYGDDLVAPWQLTSSLPPLALGRGVILSKRGRLHTLHTLASRRTRGLLHSQVPRYHNGPSCLWVSAIHAIGAFFIVGCWCL